MSKAAFDDEKLERLLKQIVLVDTSLSLPLYAQVMRGLRQLIQEHFEDGERFYGEEMLSQRLSVSISTVRRALAELSAEGLLVRHVPRGTFVRKCAKAKGKEFTVSVFLSSFESSFNMVLLEKMALRCQESGYCLEIFHTCYSEKLIAEFATFARSPEKQGFIFLTTYEAATWNLYQALVERGYRTVVVDRRIPGFPGVYLGVDNAAGMRLGMDHLRRLGHQRITLLCCEDEMHPNVKERIHAFQSYGEGCELMKTSLVTCDQNLVYPGDLSIEEKYDRYVSEKAVNEVLATNPTAIFALSDAGARVLLRRLAERGVRVPEACSVLGFDNDGACALTYPPLSSVAQPFEAMAQEALSLLEQPAHSTATHVLPPTLKLRKSTAPPAS